MLTKLHVKNFRNFNDWFVIDLLSERSYEFSKNAVQNDIVKHSIIYGSNGAGKSNLGLALLDITTHLTDTPPGHSLQNNYLNANSDGPLAEFVYEFVFDDIKVMYHCGKKDVETIVYEQLLIDGECVIDFDRRKSSIATFSLTGAEHLRNNFSGKNISPTKYLDSNTILESNSTNRVFNQFMAFVEGMVFFRTLIKSQEFYGQPLTSQRVSQFIIRHKKLDDFQTFLNRSGIECKLKASGAKGDEIIEFDFDGKGVEFSLAASTGTISLGNFYYWYLKLCSGEITFAYIDEFDAYYHFALARQIVNRVSETTAQTIFTTHNISLMSNSILRPDCYFVMEKNSIKPLNDLTDRDLRKAHNLEKMYRSGAFDPLTV